MNSPLSLFRWHMPTPVYPPLPKQTVWRGMSNGKSYVAFQWMKYYEQYYFYGRYYGQSRNAWHEWRSTRSCEATCYEEEI